MEPTSTRLLRFASALQRAASYEELLARTLEEVRAVPGSQHAWLFVADDASVDSMRLIGMAGPIRSMAWAVAPVLTVKGDAMLEEIVAGDHPVVIEDARTDPRTDKQIVEQLGNRTIINIPLRLVDKPFGAFGTGTFGDEGCRAPSPADLDYLVGMATQLAVAAGRLRFEVDRHTEAALRASEAKLRAVLDNAHNAYVEMDDAGRIADWNPRAEEIFGWSRADVLGRLVADVLIPEKWRAAHHAGLATYVATGHGPVIGERLEITALRRDGSEFPVELSVTRVPGPEIRFTAFIQDISARKQAEQALASALESAEFASREYEAFSYSVAHDLRAPLRAIDGFSQVLVEDYGAVLDPSARAHLAKIRGAAIHMAELIDDLLGLARVSRSELIRDRVDLSQLARGIVATLRGRDPTRDVEVAISDGLVTRGDARLLGIALDNLLENAWKFTSRRARAHIEIGRERDGAETVYFVRDDGAGFDMSFADKLFGVFQRLHGYHEFQGTGIGLATVQRIVRRHGGRIWAEGGIDQGATFRFTLGD